MGHLGSYADFPYIPENKKTCVFKYSQKQLLQMQLSQTAESAPSRCLYNV